MLITNDNALVERYTALAIEAEIDLKIERIWKPIYRVNTDVVIATSDRLYDIHPIFYTDLSLILNKGELPFNYMNQGVTRFIFDKDNDTELLFAFYKSDVVLPETPVQAVKTEALNEVLATCSMVTFREGNYNFNFDLNQFKYKDKEIYLSDKDKIYLAKWLLKGNRDSNKRVTLCNLRKKFGKDFLKDIDRYGELKK